MGENEHLARIRAALGGQLAPITQRGGRAILWRCARCGQPWLMEGGQSYPRLDSAQLAAKAAELRADLATLPYATCPICGAQGIGEINLDAYGRGRGGLGLNWEAVDPPGGHILATVFALDWLSRLARTGHIPPAEPITDFAKARELLAWASTVKAPAQYQAFTKEDSADLARLNRPGYGAPGTDGWLWRGARWHAGCPPLGGKAFVSLAQAMPPGEPYSLSMTLDTWRQLARIVLAGPIAGEPR